MGFYPVNPADGRFILGSPALDGATLTLSSGKTFQIIAEGNSPEKRNVSAVFLNGERVMRNFITYEEIIAGGELRFVMK